MANSRYNKEKRKNNFLTALLVILVAGGIGAGVYAATNYDSLDDKEKTTQVEESDDQEAEDEQNTDTENQ